MIEIVTGVVSTTVLAVSHWQTEVHSSIIKRSSLIPIAASGFGFSRSSETPVMKSVSSYRVGSGDGLQ